MFTAVLTWVQQYSLSARLCVFCIDRQTDGQTDRQTGRQTDRLTGIQKHRQTFRLTDKWLIS